MPFSSPRTRRLVYAGFVLVCAPLISGSGAAEERARGDFVQILTSLGPEPTETELDDRAAALAAQPKAVSAYLDAVSTGHVADEESGIAVALTEDQRRLLARTSAHLQPRSVMRTIQDELIDESSLSWRRCAFELLALHGTRDDLSILEQLVKERRSGRTAHAELLAPFQETATEIGRRTGWDDREIRWIADEVEAPRRPLLRAAGKSGDPGALPWIADQLDHDELGAVALQEVGRVGGKASPEVARETALLVIPLLESHESSQRRQAIRALGELRDSASIPLLIALLGEDSPTSERDMAHAALVKISGLEVKSNPAAWKHWFDEEQRWFKEDRPHALERLRSENDADVVAALRELSERRLHREKVAAKLLPLLEVHSSPTVRQQTCLALMRLDSKSAIPSLTMALDDEELAVRDAAHKALCSIAGLPLPPDRDAWRAALGLSK